MNLKSILIAATAFSIFAFEANAQVKDASKTAPEATQKTPKDCVMFSGEADQNCDGVADTRGADATDYNSSRSNKSYSAFDVEPDGGSDGADAEDASVTDYNSSRSNKADGAIEGDQTPDEDVDEDKTKATDYNSSRSNKSF